MFWAVAQGVAAPQWCAEVIALGDARLPSRADVDGGQTTARDSLVAWLEVSPETQGVYERVMEIGQRANADLFGFTLGSLQALQYTRYGAGQHYDWHMDLRDPRLVTPTTWRKLSLSLALRAECEGGEFEVMEGSAGVTVPLHPGDAVVFPSFLLHRVRPVTRGERISLVAWFEGPVWT